MLNDGLHGQHQAVREQRCFLLKVCPSTAWSWSSTKVMRKAGLRVSARCTRRVKTAVYGYLETVFNQSFAKTFWLKWLDRTPLCSPSTAFNSKKENKKFLSPHSKMKGVSRSCVQRGQTGSLHSKAFKLVSLGQQDKRTGAKGLRLEETLENHGFNFEKLTHLTCSVSRNSQHWWPRDY